MEDRISYLKEKANNIRINIIESLYRAKSGHPGPALSIVEIVTVLYFSEMNLNQRIKDRLVLSKGHGVAAIYGALTELGLIDKEELYTLRKIGSRLQGHPDMTKLPLLDAGTGALGQGLSIAIGYALAARLLNSPSRVYCIIGDGETQEGQIWEAAMFAPVQKLDSIVVILDNNKLQNEASVVNTLSIEPIADRWNSFGWKVISIDGHDISQIKMAFAVARDTKEKPTIIVANTVKGKGIPFMENNMAWHSKTLEKDEYTRALEYLKRV